MRSQTSGKQLVVDGCCLVSASLSFAVHDFPKIAQSIIKLQR